MNAHISTNTISWRWISCHVALGSHNRGKYVRSSGGCFHNFFFFLPHCSTFIKTFAYCVCMKNEDNFRNLFDIFKKMDAIVFTAVSFLTNWRIDVNSMSYARKLFSYFSYSFHCHWYWSTYQEIIGNNRKFNCHKIDKSQKCRKFIFSHIKRQLKIDSIWKSLRFTAHNLLVR